MGLHWSASIGIILLVQQVYLPDSLIIAQQGETIAIVSPSEYTLPLPGVPVIDVSKLRKFIGNLSSQIYRAPVNATFDGQGRIIPEQAGSKLDQQRFTEQFYSYVIEGGSSKLEVPRLTTHPKVSSELLALVREKKIGQYMTYYNASNKSRSHNVLLASQAINNHVVFPGETFSFNQVVGKRSAEKGYLPAPIIVKGEMSEGIGGGICQISSTLFNAVDHAGLQIVQRYSHSRSVPYVPPGRDATVSWYGPDFVFKNKYNQPVLIRSTAQGGRVIITIYSSDVVNDKQREVPSALEQLPEEIGQKRDANG